MIRISKIDAGDLQGKFLTISQKAAQEVAEKAIRWAVQPTLEKIKALAPTDTRALKVSIGVRHKYYKKGALRYSVIGARMGRYDTPRGVKEPVNYAYFIEFGHLPKGAGKLSKAAREKARLAVRPHPFMRPAWEATKDEVMERMRSKFGSELRIVIQKTASGRRRRAK